MRRFSRLMQMAVIAWLPLTVQPVRAGDTLCEEQAYDQIREIARTSIDDARRGSKAVRRGVDDYSIPCEESKNGYLDILRIEHSDTDDALRAFQAILEASRNFPSIPYSELKGSYIEILRERGGAPHTDDALRGFQAILEASRGLPSIPYSELKGSYIEILKIERFYTKDALRGFQAILDASRNFPSIPYSELKGSYIEILRKKYPDTIEAAAQFRQSLPLVGKGVGKRFEELRKRLTEPAVPAKPGGEGDPEKLFKLPWDNAL